MPDCLFCRIIAGEISAERVYESEHALAFLDVSPAAEGHTLVIPKTHATTLTELDNPSIGELFGAVKAVMMKISKALQPSAFHVGWNHGADAGQHVFHLHVHVLPRKSQGSGVQALGEGGSPNSLAKIAATIRTG